MSRASPVDFCLLEPLSAPPVGSRRVGDPMTTILTQVLIPVAVASVAAVLVLGLINMIRGGNPWRSQYLMQMRVLLQFVALVIVMWRSG
jgi:H+/Cl- antiporter ClcA